METIGGVDWRLTVGEAGEVACEMTPLALGALDKVVGLLAVDSLVISLHYVEQLVLHHQSNHREAAFSKDWSGHGGQLTQRHG